MRFQLTGSRSQRHIGLIWIDGYQRWRSKCTDEVAMCSFNMNAFLGVGSSELSDIPWVRRATDLSQLKVGLSDCYWVLGYPKINSVSFHHQFCPALMVRNQFSMITHFWLVCCGITNKRSLLPEGLTFCKTTIPNDFQFFRGQGGSNTKFISHFVRKSQKPK